MSNLDSAETTKRIISSKESLEEDARGSAFAPTKEQLAFLNGQFLAAKFGNMVTIMMQSPLHEKITLSDLHDHLVPALLHNQYCMAEAKNSETGETVPVGLILWAVVSDNIHNRLKSSPEPLIHLSKAEWKSGDNFWIIDAIGPQKILIPLLTNLRKTEFKKKTVHYRAHSEEGIIVKTFHEETN